MPAHPRQYEHVIPGNNPEVARIMAEQNVGRRRAYSLAKKEAAKAIDTRGVQMSQRIAVMSALINDDAARTSVSQLVGSMHKQGIRIDTHDSVKTLWALQKQGWVSFRERSNGVLYAIRVKPEGYEGYRQLANGRTIDAHAKTVEEVIVTAAVLQEAEASVALDSDPDMHTQSVEPEVAEEEDTTVPQAIDLAGYPLIAALMKRAEKIDRLNVAASILSEIGEDDLALAVMEQAGINPLEKEVVSLIREVL